METAQCLQIVFSGALVLATVILALITYGYMKATKKMAESMETQTAIMAEGYERNIAPICRLHFATSATDNQGTKIRIAILNYGKEIFTVFKLVTNIWNTENPQAILQNHEQNENIIVPPVPNIPEAIINIRFNPEVSRLFPDRERKLKIESIFIVKDIKDREHSFSAGPRSLI